MEISSVNYKQRTFHNWLLQSGAQPSIKGNWIYIMKNHIIIILHQLHSSELHWLHSNLIYSQTEDAMQDFPIVQQTLCTQH